MDQNQLQQLIEALQGVANGGRQNVGGAIKPPKLESLDPEQFRVWRNNFVTTTELNNWDVPTSKRVARASLFDEAARSLHSIDIEVDNNAFTLVNLLDAYEARVVVPAASALAEAAFESAKQLPNENCLAFHTRLRNLCSRAYPDAGDLNNYRPLLSRYINGLADAEIRLFARNQAPDTYAAVLQAAQRCEASLIAEANTKGDNNRVALLQGLTVSGNSSVNNLSPTDEQKVAAVQCYFPLCNKFGHMARECEMRKKAEEYFRRFQPSGNGGSVGRGSRGSPQNRGRGRFMRGLQRGRGRGRGSSVNAMSGAEEGQYDDADDDEYNDDVMDDMAQGN